MIEDTSERIRPGRQVSARQHLLLLRHQFAYDYAGDRLASDATVVEVGCGEGYGAGRLAARSPERVAQIVGLDVDSGVVARASAEHGSNKLRFEVYDGDRIPFPDGHFDAALSFQVVEHIADDRGYLAEIGRVLGERGTLFLTTPNRLTRVDPGRRPWNRYHVREYAPADLDSLLRGAFEQVEILGMRGTDEVESLEHERLRSIRKVAAIDVFGLRDRAPEWVKQAVGRLVEGRTAPVDERIDRYSVSDFRATPDDLDRSLDLLAVCRRAR